VDYSKKMVVISLILYGVVIILKFLLILVLSYCP